MALTGRLELLTKTQLEQVHEASLKILKETGVYFNCSEAVDLFKVHGFRVDGKNVFFTENNMTEALKTCPSLYNFRARNPKMSMQHGIGQRNKLLVSACYGSPFVSENGVERNGTARDYIDFTKLVQACNAVTFAGGILTEPVDIPAGIRELTMFYYSLKHSDKLLLGFSGTKDKLAHIFKMAQIAFEQGEELWNDCIMAVPVCPTSPLKYEVTACESLLEFAKKGQPVYIVNCLMAGVTSPISILGTAVQQNCEFLAGLVLAQLVKPGTPVVYVPGSTTANMRMVCYANGSPEANMCNLVGLQLAYYYNLPNRVMSGITDSKVVDYQAGMETMQNHLLLTAAGAQCLHNGVGTLNSLISMSFPKFVLDAECVDRINIIAAGIPFGEEELAVGDIMEVGAHGSHLMSDSTLDHYDCRWEASLSCSGPYSQWEEQGSKDASQRAQIYAGQLIGSQPAEGLLPERVDLKLKNYLESISGTA